MQQSPAAILPVFSLDIALLFSPSDLTWVIILFCSLPPDGTPREAEKSDTADKSADWGLRV